MIILNNHYQKIYLLPLTLLEEYFLLIKKDEDGEEEEDTVERFMR